MKNKICRYLAIILIINMLLISTNLIFCNISLGLGESMKNEVGPKPPVTYDDDKTKVDIPSGGGHTDKKVQSNYIYYNNIEGNAYEQIHEEKGQVIDYNNNPGIQYIKVQAINETDGTIYQVYTDKNGNYSFKSSNLTAGSYTLKFSYGGEEEITNSDVIKNNLKYNGLDYTAMAAGNTKDVRTTMEKTIIHSATGATEVMLAIDCSSSAWNTFLENGQSRLEVQKEAAKKLIESLLDEKNVYIGIVGFAGGTNSAWLAIHATNNKNLLMETLDEMKPGGKCDYTKLPGGTNIIQALNKAESSFVSDKSNKWIVLLSDGAPTTDGKDQIYSDDSDTDLLKKLKSISKNTKKKVIQIINKGINMCSFIVDSTDLLEKSVVEEIFTNVDGNRYFHSSDEEATKIIKEDILKHIVDETTIKEEITNTVDTKEFDGIDDSYRRNYVNQKYSQYNYQKSIYLENLINNYTTEKIEQAKIFLQDTYITVTVKQKYSIDKLVDEDEDYWYFEIAGRKSKDKYSEIVRKTYSGQNLELRKRETLDMDVSIKITGYRLILANGAIYNQKTTNGVVDRDLNKDEIIKEIKEIGDSMYLQSIDEKLMYGARVDIEYTIILKNISSIPVANVTLINYLTDFTGNDLQILEYDENQSMITNKYTNAQYGWKKVTKESLLNKVSDITYENMKNDYYITLNTEDSNLLRQGQQIGANGERYIKLVLSKHLSTDTKNDNTDFSDTTEILEYSNDLAIRMKKTYTDLNGKTDKANVIPGNTIEGTKTINGILVTETDYAKSMRVVIIPPTGKRIDAVISVIIFIEVLLIVLIRRLRVISRR